MEYKSFYLKIYSGEEQGWPIPDLYRKNSLKLIELSSINKVSLV
jgi:hypothetical protein